MKKFILSLIIVSVVTGVAICLDNIKQANSKLNALVLANIEALSRGEIGSGDNNDRYGYKITDCFDKKDKTKLLGRKCKRMAPEYICNPKEENGKCPKDEEEY